MKNIILKLIKFIEWIFSEEFPHQAENCRLCQSDTIEHHCFIGRLLNKFGYYD